MKAPIDMTLPRRPTLINSAASFAAFSLASFLAPAASRAESLSLNETITKIVDYQPLLRVEKEKLNEIDAEQGAVLATALPSINGNATWTRKDDALTTTPVSGAPFGGDPYNNYNAAVTINAPLYQGGAVSGARRAAHKDEQIQNLSVEKTQRDIVIQGIQLFHQILLAQRSLETNLRLNDIQEKLLALAQRRFNVGSETRLTVLTIKTQLALIAPQITQARNQLSLLAAQLADMAGLENLKELSIQGRLGPWGFDISSARKIEERPEWKTLQLQLARIDDERTVTLSKHFPQLSAFGTVGRAAYKAADLGDGDSNAWNFGLQLQIPIFSGLESMYERREFKSRELQTELQTQDLAKNLELERVRAAQSFQNAKDVEKASLTAFQEAQEAVQVAQTTYQNGTTDYLQASETQKNLADADHAYAQSEYDVLVAFTQCYVANGWTVNELPKIIESSLTADNSDITKKKKGK